MKKVKMKKETIKDKVAVITGAGGGIGRAIAVKLAQAGCKIVLLGGNNLERLEQTKLEVKKLKAQVISIPGDLTDNNFLLNCLEEVIEKFAGMDILINNAGMALNTPFEETSAEQLDLIYQINVRTPFILSQQALPHLRKSKYAAIINMASSLGHKGYAGQAAYAASKHAIRGWSKSLADEVYQQGIRVHTVCPGGVLTEMLSVARPDLTEEGMIMPQDVARVVLFLLEHRTYAVIDEINIRREDKTPYEI